MAGTLTTSAGVTFFRRLTANRLPTANSLDTSNVHIRNQNMYPKASLHAVINEPLIKPKMKTMSLYEVLDVNRNATISEIKSAYRRLAKRYHPDACGSKQNDTDTDNDNDNDRNFVEICNAYVTLSDPTTRALYDFKLSRGFDRRSGGMYVGAGERSEFFAGRRWETDQCW